MKYRIGLAIFSWSVFLFFTSFSINSSNDFWSIKGTLVTHYFEDITDSHSGPELFELQNENGLPVWFGRHIFKDVCISGECKMIRLWVFWDGTGNYLGIQIPEEEPLTKSDHTPFEPEDYEKLEGILRDTASILKDLKQEDLIVVPDSIDPYMAYEVDGYTAATQPALAKEVVKDAVYSCHTLWHTVYGPVQSEIFNVLENHLSKDFLEKIFQSKKAEYILWAIEKIQNYPEFHDGFYQDIMACIKSENAALANRALAYFHPPLLDDTTIQLQLVQVMADENTNMSIKYEILWKLIRFDQIHQKAVLNLLELVTEQKIGVSAYNLILRLVTSEHLKNNEQIAHILNRLSNDKNGYVRNLTKRALEEKD